MTSKIVAVAVLAMLMAGCGKSKEEKAIDVAQQAKYAKEAEQRRVGYAFADAIKLTMRDPSSYQSELIAVNQDATLICLKYSAANAFGGRVPGISVFSKDGVSSEFSAWEEHCQVPGMDIILIR